MLYKKLSQTKTNNLLALAGRRLPLPTSMPSQVRNSCPHCHVPMTFTQEFRGNHKPTAGDFAICTVCHKLGIYTEDLQLRLPTTRETHECQKELKRLGFSDV